MSSRAARSGEEGFTIVEVLVAAIIMVVGLLGLLTLVEGAAQTASRSKTREGATNVAREVLEKSRSVRFADLSASALTAAVRTMPGMGGGTGPWTLSRRGIDYTVSPDVCAIDDASDGIGAHDTGGFCPGTPASDTADIRPIDFKRVAVSVSWRSRDGSTATATLASVRSSRSGADAPLVSSLTATSPSVPDPQAPVISDSAVTSVTFKILSSTTATAVRMTVDGVDQGAATAAGAGAWTFTLNVAPSAMKDGVYTVGARAVDAAGLSGATVSIPLSLIRQVPAAPSGLVGGRNDVTDAGTKTSVAELDWVANTERTVRGYRVYRPDGTLACPTSATTLRSETWCVDTAPKTGTYSVAAVYYDASGTLREGPRSTVAVQAPARVFYFKNTQASTSSSASCGSGVKRYKDLAENYAGTDPAASEPTTVSDDSWKFCSPPLSAFSTSAGTSTVFAYMSNTGNNDCTVSVSLDTGVGSLGTATQTVLHASALSEYQFAFTGSAATVPANSQVVATWSVPPGAACNATRVNFGGTTNRSRVELVKDWITPAAPTTLSATRASDGSVTLSWPASSTASSSLFGYRIYRDGKDWTDRLGVTEDATTLTFLDPNRDGATHTYWVTAVSTTLSESAQTGPVTG